MGANFKVNPKLISFLVFIGLYLITRSVEAELPNEDVMKAASCMRKFFGDDVAIHNFRDDGNTLTDGEYLGIICENVVEEDLYDAIDNYADKDYNGLAIKECLQETNSVHLFQKYIDLGQKQLVTPADGTVKQDDEPQKSETNQTTSPQTSKSNTESRDEISKQDDGLEESEDEALRAISSQDSKSDTAVIRFKMGACQSGRDLKPVEFSELKNEKDEKDTLNCLRKCTTNFVSRVINLLTSARDEAINSSSIGLSEQEIDNLNNIPDSSKKFTKEKLDSELNKAAEALSIDLISKIGKGYLITYHELYYNLDKYRTEDLSKESHIELGYLDDTLLGMRLVYQNCAKLGCAMTPNSTPLYNLLQAGTNDDVKVVLKPFENDEENINEWVSSHTSNWQKFCKAFMIEP